MKIYLAFAAIYLIWGSTFLGIRFTIETMPPLFMSGFRFLLAGLILFLYARLQGVARPTARQFKSSAIIGVLLVLIGNGGVAWAEQAVPSSMAALLIATVPLWITLLGYLFFGKPKPDIRTVLGLILGLAGVLVLIGPDNLLGQGNMDVLSMLIIVVGTVSWAFGSLYAARGKNVAAPIMSSAVQMLTGGVLQVIVGFLIGEYTDLNFAAFSTKSILAFCYLVVFGSLIGFSSYSWLIRVAPPSRVATYAFVNPLVAVLLGWFFANEPVTMQMLFAGLLILPAVILILQANAKKERVTSGSVIPTPALQKK
ncbi:EamA family transporter [Adhaeribacter pallidiroseus]|uniref:Putative inner membrane transporter n=1 Tax=Adhaeribacter pallidiroseus TaxID=2072847 RepID=A0A369QGL0_9BACT|nr:EamA family transporter [Adhaeribacter pallidiroseus]RDC64071.1 putative inner membrane transporter [Adhaeribacter pallidiroseus]